eukprot:169717-Lingulodinium_polyedra.AAC.1
MVFDVAEFRPRREAGRQAVTGCSPGSRRLRIGQGRKILVQCRGAMYFAGAASSEFVETFKETERAARRLAALVGYWGVGAVEFLYGAAMDCFYSL